MEQSPETSDLPHLPPVGEDMSLHALAKVMGCTYGKVYRLCTKGRTGVSGSRVYLERWQSENGWSSSPEALERFRGRLNDPGYR